MSNIHQNYIDPLAQSVIIGKPRLRSFLRTKLRMIGIVEPYDLLDSILTSRKTGYDIANYYDTFSNLTSDSLQGTSDHTDVQEELRELLSSFIDTCPMTSFLLHVQIVSIVELPDGLQIFYLIDREQLENTRFNQPPEGYIPGTIVGY